MRLIMKTWISLLLACLLLSPARAQEEIDPAQLLQEADAWVNENIDDDVLDALGVDRKRTQQFLGDLARQFQGEYVLDMASLKPTATQLIPVLEQYEETFPYALWLRAHFDYFDASEALRKQAPRTTNNTVRPPKPSAQAQRAVWVKVVEERPVPRGARELLPRLKQIFREERVPVELVWVAEVESSFDPRAKSPAGAAGLYQLMPVTARSLDVSVGFFSDERLNAEKCARAAAKYLRQLYLRFGDWRLALAAYNCGPTRVADLLKRHKTKSFDVIAPHLPAETQMYVPKVEAIVRKREGRELSKLKLA